KKKISHILTLVIFLLLRVTPAFSQGNSFFSSNAVRDFIYNFQEFVASKKKGVLCLYGYDEVIVNIRERYKDKNILDVENDKIENLGDDCKIVYISRNKGQHAQSVIDKLNKQDVMSISFVENFIEYGGTIYMTPVRRGIGLVLNYEKIKDLKIQINPVLYNIVINKN